MKKHENKVAVITGGSSGIGYGIADESIAQGAIVNTLGVEVARLFSGEMGAGEHSFSWSDPAGLQDGVYDCLVRMNGQVQTLPIILLH